MWFIWRRKEKENDGSKAMSKMKLFMTKKAKECLTKDKPFFGVS